MGYKGNTAPIPLGQLGLRTDDSMTSLPPNAAIKANNVDFFSSRLEKSKGSTRYNTNTLSGAVEGIFDWWPVPTSQRCIAATIDGNVYRDTGSGTFSIIKSGLNALSNACFFTAGGQEASPNNRKLFLFSALNQVQVLDGDGSSMHTIAYPALDWISGSYPTVGVIFQNRLVAASKHFIYLSNSFTRNTALSGTIPIDNIPTWNLITLPVTTSSPVLDWTSTTYNGSGVTNYIITLKRTSDNAVISGPTAIGNVTSYVFTGLALVNGISYYATLQAYTSGAVLVYTVNSQSFTVDTSATGLGVNYSTYGHEDFRTSNASDTTKDAAFFEVFPGEGEEIISLNVYKGRLFIFKRPFGVYYINTNNSVVPVDWGIQKLTDSFGIASAHAIIQPQDDLVVGNNTNSITSMQATQAFGDVKSGDILANNQIEQYYKSVTSTTGIPFMHAAYYAEKKKAYFTGRTLFGTNQNQILVIDVARNNSRFSLETKDQPTCLGLRKGTDNIQKPFYGSDNGNIYLMEGTSYNVNGAPYLAEFQTPYTDLSYVDPSLASKSKIFDFLEVQFVSTGNWAFFVDVFCDNRFVETLTYNQQAGAALDTFILDVDRLAVEYTQELRLPMHATGRRISLRIYNNGLNQFYRVEKLIVSFRVSAEQQAGITGNFSV